MFTEIEGEWDEVMAVVKEATLAMTKYGSRVSLVLKADIRPGHTGELDGKVGLRIDVNARWDRITSLKYLPKLAEAGVELFEQPTPAHDLATLREITRRIGVPVMADESVCSPADALAVVREEAADVKFKEVADAIARFAR